MKILLTGSTGFLGARLLRHLSKEHEVVPYTGNILDLWEKVSCDAAIHAVGLNDATCRRDPAHAFNVNVTGTHNLLSVLGTDCKKVIYLSTIHVYGNMTGEITERHPIDPQSAYAMSHFLSEEMVLRHKGGTVLRMANGFGCPADYERETAWVVVLNSICRQSIEKRKISLYVAEKEERNFITATDICGAVSHLISTPQCGVFNVGSSKAVRIVDMARRVSEKCQELFGFSPEVELMNPASWEFYNPTIATDHRPKLDYRINKLISSGFTPSENYNDEIVNTLKLIYEHQEVAV